VSIRSIIAGVSAAALAFATVSTAFADDYRAHHNHRDRRGYEYNDESDYYNNRYNTAYDDQNDYRSYKRRNRGDDDTGTAIGIGVGVVGLALLLGAISSGNKNKNRQPLPEHRDNRDGWYRGDANRDEDGNWRNPDGSTAFGGNYTRFSSNDCLETREYQSRVTVGGRSREAYGTSCLMRNGQWVQGQPQLVPEGR
jgi:hypothetical protein